MQCFMLMKKRRDKKSETGFIGSSKNPKFSGRMIKWIQED